MSFFHTDHSDQAHLSQNGDILLKCTLQTYSCSPASFQAKGNKPSLNSFVPNGHLTQKASIESHANLTHTHTQYASTQSHASPAHSAAIESHANSQSDTKCLYNRITNQSDAQCHYTITRPNLTQSALLEARTNVTYSPSHLTRSATAKSQANQTHNASLESHADLTRSASIEAHMSHTNLTHSASIESNPCWIIKNPGGRQAFIALFLENQQPLLNQKPKGVKFISKKPRRWIPRKEMKTV